jgi:DNA-binding response OmpR family regulator
MPFRLLLVEDQMSEARFIAEAIQELEEQHNRDLWPSRTEVIHVQRLDEAQMLLERYPFHAVLLDLWLADSHAVHTWVKLQPLLRETPVIVLLDQRDEALAVRMIREGAQDVLCKSEIDCLPLARTVRFAFERQRLMNGMRLMAAGGAELAEERSCENEGSLLAAAATASSPARESFT